MYIGKKRKVEWKRLNLLLWFKSKTSPNVHVCRRNWVTGAIASSGFTAMDQSPFSSAVPICRPVSALEPAGLH